MSFDLYCNGKSSFYSHLMEVWEYFNLSEKHTAFTDYYCNIILCQFGFLNLLTL